MGIQDETGTTNPNPPSTPVNQLQPDVRTSDIDGSDEHNPKVRKPYTITKQREKWSEEEHENFLEAIQLYGRAWRRIEEHIGTKTAVQIRSHAQKFFSKVVRESAADSTSNAKPIEIPPPRPKRKPSHPYPRKLGNTCSNVGLSLRKLESSSSLAKSSFEQEDGSPTSVLSGVGSNPCGSSIFSNLQNSCTSPVTSAAGSNENEPCVEEENDIPSSGQTTRDQSPMELDISSEDKVEDQVPCLKLFGKTVLVNDSPKLSSSTLNIGIQEPSTGIDTGALARTFPLGLSTNHWNPWSGGMFPLLYSLPSGTFGDIADPSVARIIPLPWWGMCGNLPPIPFVGQQDKSSSRVAADEERPNEGSCTGSNTAAASDGANPCSAAERSKNANTQSKRSGSDSRGFVPYKRCAVEREVEQRSRSAPDDGEGQLVALCL